MAHFKRKRPKHRRAGCLLCKMNGRSPVDLYRVGEIRKLGKRRRIGRHDLGRDSF